MGVYVWLCTHVSAGACGSQKRASDPLELHCVETKLRSSMRSVCALKHWASPKGHFLVSSLLWSQKPSLSALNNSAVWQPRTLSLSCDRNTNTSIDFQTKWHLHGHIISVAGGQRQGTEWLQSTSESSLKGNNNWHIILICTTKNKQLICSHANSRGHH